MDGDLKIEDLNKMWDAKPTSKPEFCMVPVDGVWKTVRLDSPEFKRWLDRTGLLS